MLDISKLERRWLKYKIKKMLPYALLISTIVILGFAIPFMLSTKPSTTALIILKKDAIGVKPPIVVKAENIDEPMVLEPSMNFIESMDTPSNPIKNTDILAYSSANPSPKTKTLIAQRDSLQSPALVTAQVQVAKPPQLVKGKLTSIKRDDAAFDIHEIEDRFKNNSNPNLGVYIAKYHYDHGNYSEAYNYALKTNAINSTIDDSWLIFTKSLVKLGKEEQAKKTLQLYISNSNSQAAKNYLDTLDRGNLK